MGQVIPIPKPDIPEVFADFLHVVVAREDSEEHCVGHVVEPREELPLLIKVVGQGPLAKLQLFREVGKGACFRGLTAVATLRIEQLVVSSNIHVVQL